MYVLVKGTSMSLIVDKVNPQEIRMDGMSSQDPIQMYNDIRGNPDIAAKYIEICQSGNYLIPTWIEEIKKIYSDIYPDNN